MSLQNVSKGLKPVLTSELLSLLGVVLFSIVSTMRNLSSAVVIVFVLIAIAALVMSLVLCLKGLKLCASEEENFKTAYEINISMIVVEVMYMFSGVLKEYIPFFETFTKSSTITAVFETIANISIVLGIKRCFIRTGDNKSEKFARGVTMLCFVSGIIEIVMAIVGASLTTTMTADSSNAGIAIAMVVFVLFSAIAYISYLALLKKAIKKLA